MTVDFHVDDGRCEHGSLTMGCLYCQITQSQLRPRNTPDDHGTIIQRIADLERTRAVDSSRIAVLEAEANVSRTTQLGLEKRIAALEAAVLNLDTGR